METEIKLGFDNDKSLLDVLDSDWFKALCPDGQAVTYLLGNSYLDTPELTISKRGGMIRVRHYCGADEDFYEYTVKYGGGAAEGLHKRYEWNLKSDSDKFSVGSFKANAEGNDPSQILEEALEGISDQDLILLCRNTFTRTTIALQYGGSVMEACFDRGAISDSEGVIRENICELELELISGDVSAIEHVSDIILANASCKPFDDTKYHRTIKYISRG